MGSIVAATCQCGVDVSIMVGGGMSNFMTTCYFPCLCKHCHAIVEANLLVKQMRCPQCKTTKIIPYDDSALSESVEKDIELETIVDWNTKDKIGRELKLTSGKYKYPQCGQMTLNFANLGCWD